MEIEEEKETETIVVEPLENPVPRRNPEPVEEPVEAPVEPEREPAPANHIPNTKEDA